MEEAAVDAILLRSMRAVNTAMAPQYLLPVAFLVLLIVLMAVAFRTGHREGLLYAPFTDALGDVIPVPGDPDRNILRRSTPPSGFPQDGLMNYYFETDPSMDSSYEFDFCEIDPSACMPR